MHWSSRTGKRRPVGVGASADLLVSPKTCPHLRLSVGRRPGRLVGGRIQATTHPRVVSGFLIPDVHAPAGVRSSPTLSTERSRIARSRHRPRAIRRERSVSARASGSHVSIPAVRVSISLNFLSYENRTASRAAPLLFAGFVGVQLALLLAFIRYVLQADMGSARGLGMGCDRPDVPGLQPGRSALANTSSIATSCTSRPCDFSAASAESPDASQAHLHQVR